MDNLLQEMQQKKNDGPVSETEFFGENMQPGDSTGVLTAAQLWPQNQILQNAKQLIILYLVTVVLFSLTAICAVQTVFCISKKEGDSS